MRMVRKRVRGVKEKRARMSEASVFYLLLIAFIGYALIVLMHRQRSASKQASMDEEKSHAIISLSFS